MIVYLRNFLRSKAGWTAVLVHFIVVIYSFWGLVSIEGECGPFPTAAGWVYIAGTGLHWAFESPLMQILLLVDLPALAAADIIGNLIGTNAWCFIPRTWTLATLGLFFATIQWYIIGTLIAKLFQGAGTTDDLS